MTDSDASERATQQIETIKCITTCELNGINDEWPVDSLDKADELRDAIETVRADHDHEQLIDEEFPWIIRVSYNDKRECVCCNVYGYHGEYVVKGGPFDAE
jgi:hypothetical protein